MGLQVLPRRPPNLWVPIPDDLGQGIGVEQMGSRGTHVPCRINRLRSKAIRSISEISSSESPSYTLRHPCKISSGVHVLGTWMVIRTRTCSGRSSGFTEVNTPFSYTASTTFSVTPVPHAKCMKLPHSRLH